MAVSHPDTQFLFALKAALIFFCIIVGEKQPLVTDYH